MGAREGFAAAAAVLGDAADLVHVDGAVMVPGLHELAAGSRVFDAIEAAQGLRGDADRVRLNLATVLGDGPTGALR